MGQVFSHYPPPPKAERATTTSRIYISGPMSGLPELNFPAFRQAAAVLIERGWQVVNPAEVQPIGGTEWEHYMRGDIRALCECDAVALLYGWEQSKGAHLEVHIAHRLGIKVMRLEDVPTP